MDFDVHENSTANTRVYLRVVRTLLTAHLATIMPDLRNTAEIGLQWEFEKGRKGECSPKKAYNRFSALIRCTDHQRTWIHVFEASKRLVVLINCCAFFGNELGMFRKN